MKNGRDVRLKLVFAALCLSLGFWLLNAQGGLAGASVPAYVESIDHAVAPVVTGRIAEVRVKLGEAVKAGQVLVTLEDKAVRLEHERVESELAQLEADLAAQESIQKGQLVEGVLRSSSALADESAARSEADSLKLELERVERLRADKLVDAATETTVRREYLAAAARVKVFEKRRTQLPELYASNGPSVVQSQATARLQPYREALKAKRASLAELDWQLAQYEMRAPVDGVVGLLVHPSATWWRRAPRWCAWCAAARDTWWPRCLKSGRAASFPESRVSWRLGYRHRVILLRTWTRRMIEQSRSLI